MLQGEADFVEAVERAVFAVFGDVEGKGLATRGGEGLFGQVDRKLVAFVGYFFKQLVDLFFAQYNRQQAVFSGSC